MKLCEVSNQGVWSYTETDNYTGSEDEPGDIITSFKFRWDGKDLASGLANAFDVLVNLPDTDYDISDKSDWVAHTLSVLRPYTPNSRRGDMPAFYDVPQGSYVYSDETSILLAPVR